MKMCCSNESNHVKKRDIFYYLDEKLPNIIKLLLAESGFDTITSIKNINLDVISDIEKFVSDIEKFV